MERRYQGEYENRLDPFQSFSQSERKRKYGQLSVAEKVIIETELYYLIKCVFISATAVSVL